MAFPNPRLTPVSPAGQFVGGGSYSAVYSALPEENSALPSLASHDDESLLRAHADILPSTFTPSHTPTSRSAGRGGGGPTTTSGTGGTIPEEDDEAAASEGDPSRPAIRVTSASFSHNGSPMPMMITPAAVGPTAPTPSSSSSTSASPFAAPGSTLHPSPLPSPSASPLSLPAHPTTPSAGSSTEAIEHAKGINLEKLSPSDFTFGRLLGEGAFAKVVACTRKATGEAYACKIVDKQFIQKMGKVQTVLNEKRILTLLHGHVGIVKLAFTFQDQASLCQ